MFTLKTNVNHILFQPPTHTDFSHPPTAFLLPIPGRDVYFPPLKIWIIIPLTGHERKYHHAAGSQTTGSQISTRPRTTILFITDLDN